MRVRLSFCVLAISALALFGMAGAVSADMLDHFDGPGLDTNVWTAAQYTAPFTVGVAGSKVTLSADGHTAAGEIMTKDTSAVVEGDTMYFKLGAAPVMNGNNSMSVFGGWDTASTAHIQIGNWGAGWNVEVGNGTSATNTSIDAPAAGDLFAIKWTPGSVVVERNGTPIVTDTGLTRPGSSSTMFVDAFQANATNQFDLIGVNVPEPSVLVLLSTGVLGLLAYAWRKRR
jgi:hypothetical protein